MGKHGSAQDVMSSGSRTEQKEQGSDKYMLLFKEIEILDYIVMVKHQWWPEPTNIMNMGTTLDKK